MKKRSVGWLAGVGVAFAAAGVFMAASAPAHAQQDGAAGGSGLSASPARWSGWVQFDTAYDWDDPSHYANARARGELAGRGDWGNGVKWKLSARAYYDAAYDVSGFFPPAVREDQRAEIWLHETYVDFGRGDWEFRLGKQNIVWGEVVGLFVADVVSAKDLRGFILPEFDQIRIPQWAARAEWFGADSHLELIWLPAPAVNRIGKPGAEFYSYPPMYPGYGYDIQGEDGPARNASNMGYGLRFSTLAAGWDMAGFVYRAPDTQPSFYRSVAPGTPDTVVYSPRFDNVVTRVGSTLTKDFDGIVAKAEIVYTQGRNFSLTELDASNGVVGLNTIDWVVGMDATPAAGWRVNAQFFQRAFLDYDARIGQDRHENGVSLLVAPTISPTVDAEFLGIAGLNRSDWLMRAMMIWKAGARSRVRGGVDVFGGDPYGLFGQYGNRDRVWAEYRYSF